METITIELADMTAFSDFVFENAEAIDMEYGSYDAALKECIDGKMVLGGGGAPMFEIFFAQKI